MILNEIRIDFSSPVPVYEQIKRSIKHIIAKKLLVINDPMPSIRELSGFLKINPNTVARAYRDLQQEKIINGRPGKGFWVEIKETPEKEKIEMIKDEFLKFLEKGVEMGIKPEAMKKMISQFYEEDK